MSADAPATATSGPKRLKPYQISIGLGVGIGLFTLMSGILPNYTKW